MTRQRPKLPITRSKTYNKRSLSPFLNTLDLTEKLDSSRASQNGTLNQKRSATTLQVIIKVNNMLAKKPLSKIQVSAVWLISRPFNLLEETTAPTYNLNRFVFLSSQTKTTLCKFKERSRQLLP